MNKDLIQRRFSKHLDTYNANAVIQRKMAEYLIQILDKEKFNDVLEIGCGTGLLTELAIKNISYNNYIANDIVKNCKKYISKISPSIKFVSADIEEFLKNNESRYDLILSNAVFQWLEDFESFIGLLLSRLNNGGIILFSTFGKKNYSEIRQILKQTLPYRTVDEYKKILKNYSHSIEEEIYTLNFKTPEEVLKHIKLTGANAICETRWTKSDMLNFVTEYNKLCSGPPVLTYNPVYIKLRKN